jgi:dipeptidyl aminopeptidase/acylaminoacyl peptidase
MSSYWLAQGRAPIKYVIAQPEGQDRSALYLFDTATGNLGAPVASHPRADIISAMFDPKTRQVLQACAETTHQECVSTDAAVNADWAVISAAIGKERTAALQSVSRDGQVWSLFVDGSRDSGAFYIFDRATKALRKVVDLNAQLPRAAFGPTEVMTYRNRDGVDLWAYLTLPPQSQS